MISILFGWKYQGKNPLGRKGNKQIIGQLDFQAITLLEMTVSRQIEKI